MICPHCGTQNQDTNRYCTTCNYDFSANWGNQTYQQPNAWQANPNSANWGNQPYQQPNGWQANPNTVNYAPVYQKPFQSHLAMSIVSILFFWILGIIATVMSSQANNAFRMGDFAQAESKAQTAKTLAIIAYVVGGLVIFVNICLYL
jgi:uncharacterized membrane protein YvbJ